MPSREAVPGGGSFHDLKELHIENKSAGRRAWRWIFTVGEFSGNPETALFAFHHELHALGPAGDHLIQRKFRGFAALHGAVEDGAVEQSAVVVDFHGVGGLRAGALALAHQLRRDVVLAYAGYLRAMRATEIAASGSALLQETIDRVAAQYDALPYSSNPFAKSHPARMAAITWA